MQTEEQKSDYAQALIEVRYLLETAVNRMESYDNGTLGIRNRLITAYEVRLHELIRLREDLQTTIHKISTRIEPLEAVVDRQIKTKEDELSFIRGALFKQFEKMEISIEHAISGARKLQVRHPIGLSSSVATIIGVTKNRDTKQIYYVLRFRTSDRSLIEYIYDGRNGWSEKCVTDKQWAVDAMADRLWILCRALSIPMDRLYQCITTDQGEPWEGFANNDDDFIERFA